MKHEIELQLHPVKLGLAAGILWGLAMFLITLISIGTGYATGWLILMGDVYPGYTISAAGSILGLIYGFIDGFIVLFLLAWVYNKIKV
jgi:hypothetical protein